MKVHDRGSVIRRAPVRLPQVVRLGILSAPLSAVVMAGLLLSGCSSPTPGFPAVHDMPPPRADTTLSPDEIKKATDDLLTDREHLSTEAQAAQASAPNTAMPPAPAPPPPPVRRVATPAAPPAPQYDVPATAGAYAKP